MKDSLDLGIIKPAADEVLQNLDIQLWNKVEDMRLKQTSKSSDFKLNHGNSKEFPVS